MLLLSTWINYNGHMSRRRRTRDGVRLRFIRRAHPKNGEDRGVLGLGFVGCRGLSAFPGVEMGRDLQVEDEFVVQFIINNIHIEMSLTVFYVSSFSTVYYRGSSITTRYSIELSWIHSIAYLRIHISAQLRPDSINVFLLCFSANDNSLMPELYRGKASALPLLCSSYKGPLPRFRCHKLSGIHLQPNSQPVVLYPYMYIFLSLIVWYCNQRALLHVLSTTPCLVNIKLTR
jgi:hypothetical protein